MIADDGFTILSTPDMNMLGSCWLVSSKVIQISAIITWFKCYHIRIDCIHMNKIANVRWEIQACSRFSTFVTPWCWHLPGCLAGHRSAITQQHDTYKTIFHKSMISVGKKSHNFTQHISIFKISKLQKLGT